MNETLVATAKKLVENCRNGREEEGLAALYDPQAVSVEAFSMPGESREKQGIDAIKGKHEWWNATFEVHSSSVDGPFLHGDDRFGVIFEIDATDKTSGQRFAMKEVAVYTVDDAGKIVREEFFYTPDDA